MKSKWKWFWIVPLAIVGIPLFFFVGGEVVMHLWNWLLPPLFGWRMLGFWQALGLLVLCRILFGGLHHGGSGGHGGRRCPCKEPKNAGTRVGTDFIDASINSYTRP